MCAFVKYVCRNAGTRASNLKSLLPQTAPNIQDRYGCHVVEMDQIMKIQNRCEIHTISKQNAY